MHPGEDRANEAYAVLLRPTVNRELPLELVGHQVVGVAVGLGEGERGQRGGGGPDQHLRCKYICVCVCV